MSSPTMSPLTTGTEGAAISVICNVMMPSGARQSTSVSCPPAADRGIPPTAAGTPLGGEPVPAFSDGSPDAGPNRRPRGPVHVPPVGPIRMPRSNRPWLDEAAAEFGGGAEAAFVTRVVQGLATEVVHLREELVAARQRNIEKEIKWYRELQSLRRYKRDAERHGFVPSNRRREEGRDSRVRCSERITDYMVLRRSRSPRGRTTYVREAPAGPPPTEAEFESAPSTG